MFSKKNRMHTIHGILFVGLFALAANQIANLEVIKDLRLSPLIIGILLGMFYANTLRNHLPKEWVPGIVFSTKQLLRFAIILYGFRITFQNIASVGVSGITASVVMVTLTFIIGYFVGTKILNLDRDTTILTTAGSSICGAAAVLATEPVLKSEAYKSAIAVATVVLFGTIAMFLYPFLYKAGFIPLSPKAEGIYIGASIHEVAHVVAASSAISPAVAQDAIIVKMIRVMMIAPFLIVLGLFLSMKGNSKTTRKISIPWFALFFILVAGFNSLDLVPTSVVHNINIVDTFLLTMAMTALGMETNINKFKGVGMKPIYLAGILFVWLLVGGYFVTTMVI